jgi:hypothetical protein
VKIGLYKHYKGNTYEVIGVAQHSEDESHLVVYRPTYGERGLWVRPYDMFNETIEIDGKQVSRFKYIGDE